MHTPMDWIAPAIGVLTAVYAIFKHRESKPTEQERADLLAQLAEDVATIVVMAFPGKSWAEYVQMIIQRLAAKPGVPTKNAAALEGAANSALLKVDPAVKAAASVGRSR